MKPPPPLLLFAPSAADDVADRESRARELRRIDEHLVLHRLAAERRDVGDAGHRAERLVEHPVLQHVQLHRRPIGALEHVAVDETRRRERRFDFRAHAVGQPRAARAARTPAAARNRGRSRR